jgi:hypothetical protein
LYIFSLRLSSESNRPIIEFDTSSRGSELIRNLKDVLQSIDLKILNKEDLWMNDEILYSCSSTIGNFQISSDTYDCIFTLSDTAKVVYKLSEVLNKDIFLKIYIV